MTATRFDLEQFLRDAAAIARVVSAGDLFSRTTRPVQMPTSCIALVWDGAVLPRLSLSAERLEPEGVREVFLVKKEPITLRFQFARLASTDGYDFSAEVEFRVQPVAERTELGLLRRHLTQGAELKLADIARSCEELIRPAVSEFVRARPAEALLTPSISAELVPLLTDRFTPLGFSTGLTWVGDARVSLTSPDFADSRRAETLEAERRQRAQADAQRRAAANENRRREIQELIDLVNQAGDTSVIHSASQSMNPSHRADVYLGMLAVASKKSAAKSVLLVVAGQELLHFKPDHPNEPSQRLSLPADLGPLRSVRLSPDQNAALVGARTGLHIVHLKDETIQSYPWPAQNPPRGGMNAAAIMGDALFATHSEIGLIRWPLSDPSKPALCLDSATKTEKAVRDVQVWNECLFFAAGPRVISWKPNEPDPSQTYQAPADIQSLIVADNSIFAGLDNGTITQWPIGDPADIQELQTATGRPVHSLDWLCGGGAPRLLIADHQPHLTLRVLNDQHFTEYRWRRPLRWGFAADDCIAAVDESRDRLIRWHPTDPSEPCAADSIGQITGHAIQDVAILARPES